MSEEGQATRDGSCRVAARTQDMPLGLGSERPPPYLGTDSAEGEQTTSAFVHSRPSCRMGLGYVCHRGLRSQPRGLPLRLRLFHSSIHLFILLSAATFQARIYSPYTLPLSWQLLPRWTAYNEPHLSLTYRALRSLKSYGLKGQGIYTLRPVGVPQPKPHPCHFFVPLHHHLESAQPLSLSTRHVCGNRSTLIDVVALRK